MEMHRTIMCWLVVAAFKDGQELAEHEASLHLPFLTPG